MGFQRELAIEALLNTPNVEQAAEFCVMAPRIPEQQVSGIVCGLDPGFRIWDNTNGKVCRRRFE